MVTVVVGALLFICGLGVAWDLHRNGVPPGGLLGTRAVPILVLGIGGGGCLVIIGVWGAAG